MKNKSSINLEVSLVEIIFSVLIFGILGVIMLNCFAIARFTQIKANDKTMAIIKAQSFCEYIKSSSTNEEMDEILGSLFSKTFNETNSNNYIYINYYDKNWNKCNERDNLYSIKIDISNSYYNSGYMKDITISVDRAESYPFDDKLNSSSILFIETKKFFPKFSIGGQ